MLYSFNFPSEEDERGIAEKARERVIRGCTFLKDMQSQWPMAKTWVREPRPIFKRSHTSLMCASMKRLNACKLSIVQ